MLRSNKIKFFSILLFASAACTTSTQTDSSTNAAEEITAPVESAPETDVDQVKENTSASEIPAMVYVTAEGDKYHTADCRFSKTAQAIKMTEAKASGKTACGICKPNSKTGEKQLRCSATTAEGKQCQRMTSDSSGKCFQHRGS
jgi:hypothetical protein